MNKKQAFSNTLLKWYPKNKEYHLWRQTKDPYKILIAEILLRKTTRRQVDAVYESLINTYKNVYDLAEADMNKIESIIVSLGIQHKRAEIIKNIGKFIVKKYNGIIPNTRKELLSIPGVGPYSANAILCLAFNKSLPLVDTNSIRVLERVFELKSSKKRARIDPYYWYFASQLIPKSKARIFNLALLDFANKVCTARSPKCKKCVMLSICQYKKVKIIN
jgi:A/G-specific adenine glycosylase